MFNMKMALLLVVTAVLLQLVVVVVVSIDSTSDNKLGKTHGPCHSDVDGKPCPVDGYVGSSVLYEDDAVRIWNFTLQPGEMTSMHRHDYDYYFVAVQPTQLEVWGANGIRLFDFRAEGVLGFKLVGEFLEPIGIELPFPVPRVHAAKNIGDAAYYEILYENKIMASTQTGAVHEEPEL